MQVPVLIEKLGGNRFRATRAEPLGLAVEGESREEVLRMAQAVIESRLRTGAELVQLEVQTENPWLQMAGIDDPSDPLVQEYKAILAENRRKADADPDYL